MIEEIHPPVLIVSMVIATLIFAGIHLRYGPPLTFIAAGLLSFITPPIAYGIQKVTFGGRDHARNLRVMVQAMVSLYSKDRAGTAHTVPNRAGDSGSGSHAAPPQLPSDADPSRPREPLPPTGGGSTPEERS